MNNTRIIIAENELVAATEIKERLESQGYTVVAIVTSGEECFSQVADLQPNLVLMDVNLEGDVDGFEAAEHVKRYFNVPVIYMTSFTSDDMLEKAKLTEPYGYLVKPVGSRELSISIEIALHRKKIEDELERYRNRLQELVGKKTTELTETIEKLTREIEERKRAEEALKMSEEHLHHRNIIIESGIRNAQVIQKALLPAEPPKYENLEIAYRYLPLAEIGGDYFSFTPLQEGGVGIFLGDVASHGVSAALFLSLVKFATSSACRLFGQNPAQYLKQLNEDLQGNMPSSFLSAAYAHFYRAPDKNGNTIMTLALGGHPPPILQPAGSTEITPLKMKGFLLGILDVREYNEISVELAVGDRIFFYTDGIIETTNPDNELLNIEGLIELIQDGKKKPLPDALDSIFEGIDLFRDNVPIQDDIVLIGIEAK